MIDPLPAKVLKVRGLFVHIECPYCGDTHEHKVTASGKRERRAPACDLYAAINPQQRAAGYTFTPERGTK